LNPLDPEKAHMYLFNNIFFSFPADGRDLYKDYGGDTAAYISINNDLKAIRALNRAVSFPDIGPSPKIIFVGY
jgi:protein TIF31